MKREYYKNALYALAGLSGTILFFYGAICASYLWDEIVKYLNYILWGI